MESSSNCAADFGFSPIQMSPRAAGRGRRCSPAGRGCAPLSSAESHGRLGSEKVLAYLEPFFEQQDSFYPRQLNRQQLEESQIGCYIHSSGMKYFYFWQNDQFCSMRFSTCPSFFGELALPQTGVFRIAPTIYLPGSQTNTISIHEQITTRGGLTAREELRALKGKVKRAWEVSLSPKRCSLPSSHKCCFNHSFTFHNLNLQLRKQYIRLFLENEKKILNMGDKSL